MKTTMTLIGALAAAFSALGVVAMPTAEETKQAEPVVKRMLAQERAALESGKKTRSEVAAAAMKLADEADTDAAKLLLMKGAFALYVKDGNLEKAVETMKTLEAAISDMPPQSITNMIEVALLGTRKKEAGARLYKLLDEAKASISSHIESKSTASSVEERSSVASILKGMIKVPGRDYWLSATELTQGQWESVMGYNLSEHKGVNLPVDNVSRDDCDVFLEKLNQTEEVKSSQFEFRLPELEEWKYAAWAGSAGQGSWIKPGVVGNVLNMAWVKENSLGQTHAVATKAPNAFGFYDMLGNVWEWLSSPGGDAPVGRGSLKGCAFNQVADKCTWKQNWHVPKTQRYYGVGMRLAAQIRHWPILCRAGAAPGPQEGKVSSVSVGGYTWPFFVRNGEATIMSQKSSCAVSPAPTGDISIPATLCGVKVASIGHEAFKNCTGLKSVTIPAGVKVIESEAFRNCKEMTSVTIPEGVTHVDSSAFADCGLTSVMLPSSVKVLGGRAFWRCAGLTSVAIPDSVTSIGDDAFNGCRGLKSVVIPDSVTDIGSGAFLDCKGLTSVTIPAKVEYIGEGAFGGCSGLKQINVAAGNKAFAAADGVLYNKYMSVLLACPGDKTSLTIPSGVTRIGVLAFGGCNGLKSVTIPQGVKGIGDSAFKGCSTLTSVTIPSGVTRILQWTFEGCSSLESVTIQGNVAHFGHQAFLNCHELTSFTMCGERPEAPNDIFQGCDKLKSIHVPANAKSWEGMKDWNGIPLVKSSLLKPSLLSLRGRRLLREQQRETELKDAGVESVTVKTRKDIDRLFPGWAIDSEFSVDNPNVGLQASHRGQSNVIRLHPKNKETPVVLSRTLTLSDKNPCLFLKVSSWSEGVDFPLSVRVDGKEALPERIICTPDSAPWEDLVVPLFAWRGSSVKIEVVLGANDWRCEYSQLARLEIAEGSGHEKSGLVGVSYGTEQVGDYMWSYRVKDGEATVVAEKNGICSCAVSPNPTGELVIPSTLGGVKVTRIGTVAFANCKGLTSVTIPPGVKSIDWCAFIRCDGIESVMIPDGVTNIDRGAFAYCRGLKSVAFPASVTRIWIDAFKCCGALESVMLPSSVADIGSRAFQGCGGLVSVTMPSGVKIIDSHTFSGCGSLQSIVIPEGVESIKSGAFSWYCGVETVSIPSTVTNIEQAAFCDCMKLRSFHVDPANPCYRSINGLLCSKDGSYLVAGVNGDVIIPEGVTTIGSDSFHGCFGLHTVFIPSSVTNIEHWAFSFLSGLSSVRVDAANPAYKSVDGLLLTKDGRKLIRGVNGKVTIPVGMESIIEIAFSCSRLESLAIPEGVTNIEHAAFYRCSGIQTVTIPSSVKNIGGGAFGRCYDLTSVTMLGERPDVPNNIFEHCGKLKSIHVPANAKSWAGMKEWMGIPLVFDEEAEAKETVAEKLQKCDFLLNEDFKKDAKVYLCLFSASWCGPCRREMPRIAKTYAETLKDDPNIELIHFSCDQNDEKALAWAKEHDVKFPVVKPKGGNPFKLEPRGIPHLYILKADGTVMEEGHPGKLFTDEKLSELRKTREESGLVKGAK